MHPDDDGALTICFSEYLGEEMRLTASMCPVSTWYPRMYVNTILLKYLAQLLISITLNLLVHGTHFFFCRPSRFPSATMNMRPRSAPFALA